MRLKQRIVRILIREILADVEEKSREVVLVIHWAGGRHSELRVTKSETGRSRRCTDPEAIEVLRQMAGKFSDQQIAATLNRLRLRTGVGNSWNVMRVAFVQHDQPREVVGGAATQCKSIDCTAHDRREGTASASSGAFCAVADSDGSPGLRSDPQRGRQ